MTVSKGAIEKYLPTAKMLVTKYNVLDYTRQRICLTEKDIKSLFENVFPERQRTLMGFSADVCEKMIKARTGKSNGKNGYLDELKANGKLKQKSGTEKKKESKASKRSEKKIKPSQGLEKAVKKEKSSMKKKKKGISLDEFFGS